MDYTDSRDLAAGAAGMPLHELERLLQDMENEPNWRPLANKCADYYDHKQADAKRIQRSEETGEPLVIMNLIQRTINGALGQEAKTRLSWKAEPDTNAFADVAAALGERLHEVQREARSDMAISEAYSSMLRTGIGWVEVSRNPDPLAYPYRITAVHRNEVWWDWRARAADKSDSRWMVRQRWVDLDEAEVMMPQHAALLRMGCHSGPITDVMARTILTSAGQFEDIHNTRRSFSRLEEEWLDNSLRKRVRFYSVYYKRPKMEVALVSGTKRVRFNPANKLHQLVLQVGGAKLMRGPSYELRHAMFAGPYRLFDVPLKGRRFPLVPFIAYSCDDDRSPYGLVHGMIAPQDEFNERRSRLLWLLKAKQVFVEEDALADKYNNLVDLAREVMRPDAVFVLNKNRQNKSSDSLRVVMNQQLNAEQAQVMQDAKQLIQDVPGLYNALLGSGADGASSGVALNSLVEQSVTSLGETSDNYRTSRHAVGDAVSELICEDMSEPNLAVEVGTGRKRRMVRLNTVDKDGLPVNVVEDAAVRIGLGDVPSTPAYKAQQQAWLSQAVQAAGDDPVVRPVLFAALIEAGDLEHREQYAKYIRQKAGIPEPDEMDDEHFAQAQEAANQAGQQAQAVQQAVVEADVAQKRSAAVLNEAKANEIAARTAAQSLSQAMTAQPTEDDLINDALNEARMPQAA